MSSVIAMKMPRTSHLFQCPSEKPCAEEKRFPNKILDYSQLLSSTLNITQEGCEKLQRVQAQGSVVPRKRKVLHLLLIEPAYYGHFLWSPNYKCLY